MFTDRIPLDKFLAYHDSLFYVASPKCIKLFTLVDDFSEGQKERITVPESDIASIIPEDMKVHGLLLNYSDDEGLMVPMESLDNQIDFNTLRINEKPPGELSYEFIQFREVVPRNDRFDPVKQFVSVFDKWNDMFSVALRESSKVDFYFNGARSSSFTDPQETVGGVDVSFDETYVLIGKNDVRAINNELTSRIGIDEAEQKKNFNFYNVFYQKIKNHCKIFNSFVLLKTSMIVAHSNVLSFYSVLRQKWMNHIVFDANIEYIFKQRDDSGVELVVLLVDGTLKYVN